MKQIIDDLRNDIVLQYAQVNYVKNSTKLIDKIAVVGYNG